MNPIKLANPIYVTKSAFGLAGTAVGLAGTAVGLAGTAARGTVRVALAGLHEVGHRDLDAAEPKPAAPAEEETVPPGPTVVLEEPHAPEEPPVDVVGAALAAEAELGDGQVADGAGMAHEPRAASRDEEHGDAALQRAEADEIADEVSAVLDGDPEPEEHLTEPLVDPAVAKALAAEVDTMSRAADPDKG